jgi:signal peptidase II
MRSPGRVFWPLASLLVLADCSTKRVVEATVSLHAAPKPLIADVVRVTLAYNPGAAFSTQFGPYQRWVLIGVAVAMLIALAWWYRPAARTGRVAIVGLALVAGGAVGNLLDRVISNRGVVDFLDLGVGATRFFVCNLADAGISVGAALLLYALWRHDRAGHAGPPPVQRLAA